MQDFSADIVIIGAGASGMMAAHFCGEGGKKVIVLDHNKQIGRKILISGGGKANFTNYHGNDKDYFCENPHFVKSALSRFTVWDFIGIVEEHGLRYEERRFGQLFCKDSAKDINKILLKQAQKPNIEIMLEQRDLDVERYSDEAGEESGFRIFNHRISIQAQKVIIASGSIVLPSIGASDFGYLIAKKFGHKIIPTTPALVPFKVSGFDNLSGNSFTAGITVNGNYVADQVLFTHKGLSGPGILKASLFWNKGDAIVIDWLLGKSMRQMLDNIPGNVQVDKVLKKHLPNKFVDVFFDRINIDGSDNIGRLSNIDKDTIDRELHRMSIIPEGTEGYRKAEATRGGVDTSMISSKTMESKLQPGLYFIGEVMDVTGQLGGHNFQWCWASAHAVGKATA